ncbi:6-phosphogluconate dehydrogenase [Vulcanimicrobium alpinum]|uniref:6-phosphogluconate dehydrogenase n=1 Tax=Vulcanimicrobium alpinum TaxID=3016050 RepID=A0AAN2CBJ0_UNVUL|nr:NAD(P)-dependent oxidoreductase [Vulcanimicrobium alpinum]BDE07842.1 6-phosphogluconate dehydrogenase [Vulcanimicrobium alpinum]
MSAEGIGIVGLGRMGANMARRLRDVGYDVTAVYDIRPETTAELAGELGAHAASSPAEVAERAGAIITVVSDDAAMERIFDDGAASLLRHAQDRIFVNCATVTPSVHVEIERRAEAHGAQSIEACMASSITQARDGTLYLMIGGRRDAFERVRPMLETLSKSLRYIGAAGHAAKVKALVNMVMNINTAGLAEGLGLGDALGLDLTMLREVFAETGAASRVLETDGADMQNREHDVYFSAAHAAKDTHIATALAGDLQLRLPLAEATARQYDAMIALGLGELDKSGIAELTFRERATAGA